MVEIPQQTQNTKNLSDLGQAIIQLFYCHSGFGKYREEPSLKRSVAVNPDSEKVSKDESVIIVPRALYAN